MTFLSGLLHLEKSRSRKLLDHDEQEIGKKIMQFRKKIMISKNYSVNINKIPRQI